MTRIQGEAAHAKGADGARRAKRWLESTTRVNAQWVNPDPPAIPKLTFEWPYGGQTFSYDLGGVLKYGEFEGQIFFAESKNYQKSSDLTSHYSKFVAQSYVAYLARPDFCDHFMWISWSPHSATTWSTLTSEEFVEKNVLKHSKRIFDTDNQEEARKQVDAAAVAEVSKRLWIIILSEKQESLVISKEHRGLIEKYEVERG